MFWIYTSGVAVYPTYQKFVPLKGQKLISRGQLRSCVHTSTVSYISTFNVFLEAHVD